VGEGTGTVEVRPPDDSPAPVEPSRRLASWTTRVIRLRIVVVLIWLIAALLGVASMTGLSGLLTTPLGVPGTPSAAADAILVRHFGQNFAGSFTVVLREAHASPRQIAADLARIGDAARRLPKGAVAEHQAIPGLLFANITTSSDFSQSAAHTELLRHALASAGLAGAMVTGPPALQHDLTPVLTSDLRRGGLIAVVLALVVLAAVLGLCWGVFVPLVVAGATIAVDVGVIYLLAHRIPMVLYAPNVIELIALGLAVDYSLLMVDRYRTETAQDGVTSSEAILTTMSTAGRTVLVAGGIVAVGLAILCAVPVPFLRSLGFAGVVVPIVAVASALTLQPALLAVIGPRGVRPVAIGGLVRLGVTGRPFERLGRAVVRRPLGALATSAMVLALCASSVLWLQLTPASTTDIPQSLPSARALAYLSAAVGPGAISPVQVVIDLGHAHRASDPKVKAATLALAQAILEDSDVFAEAIGAKPPYADASGRYEQIVVFAKDALGARSTQQLVGRIRDGYLARARLGAGVRAHVGGAPAQGVDFLDSVYGAFPFIVLAALLLALVLLARAFRSLVLALVSVALNLLSVAVAVGLVVLLMRSGLGHAVLGTYTESQIEGWVPVFLFAVLFGLSMDYEVFIVTRIREAHDAGLGTDDAIVAGLARTGGVVSGAALIFVAAMSGLVVGHVGGIQELGIGLALGILIDATVVRLVVLPSVMALLGRWNWWLPGWAATLLVTQASPLGHREARPGRMGQRPTT
jgi:RND superfamily putative drug exporter